MFYPSTGRVNGVAKQLTDTWPWLLSVHCAAHRLALACKDAAGEVPYMNTFKEHLQQLHLYFRNSANRTAALKSAAEVLGISKLKVKVSNVMHISNNWNYLPFLPSSHNASITNSQFTRFLYFKLLSRR